MRHVADRTTRPFRRLNLRVRRAAADRVEPVGELSGVRTEEI